jgi:pimeloyl-ACP methyl ester carboxylesterase
VFAEGLFALFPAIKRPSGHACSMRHVSGQPLPDRLDNNNQDTEYTMRTSISRFIAAAGFAAAALFSTAASADTVVYSGSDGKVINAQLSVGGTSWNVDWYIPSTPAAALVTVQHGFSRGCGNYRDTSKRIMGRGLMVLCLNAPMSGGNPTLAAQFADLIASRTMVAPGGVAVPANTIVGGHSAGGHFASAVGARLAVVGYPHLKGAVLFDPVAASGFTNNLVAISNFGQRPVYAVTANGGICNQFNNAYGALRQISNTARSNGRDGFVGVQLTSGSTHVDSEGNNTDIIGYTACLNLKPKSSNTAYLRDLSAAWANDLARGTRDTNAYPGGTYVNTLISQKKAKTIN